MVWVILLNRLGSARFISVAGLLVSVVIRMVFLWRMWKMLIGLGLCGICIQFDSRWLWRLTWGIPCLFRWLEIALSMVFMIVRGDYF